MDNEEPVAVPIEDAIDLHSFSPRDIIAVVDDYLDAAHAAGFDMVRLAALVTERSEPIQAGLAWAVKLDSGPDSLGVFGLVEMAAFIVILTLGLVYAWRKGVLRWA